MADFTAIGVYEAHAAALRPRYDSVEAADVLAPVADLLPIGVDVLDIGAGSGRDSAWFVARGDRVTAVEPVEGFRAAIALRAPEAVLIDARLPDLEGVRGPFGLILVGALWHHLDSADREAAIKRITGLMVPGGVAIISLRHGPIPEGMPLHVMDPKEEIARAARAGLGLLRCATGLSHQKENIAAGVRWTWLALGKESSDEQ
jgi:SAM-dependent methyltransferase